MKINYIFLSHFYVNNALMPTLQTFKQIYASNVIF